MSLFHSTHSDSASAETMAQHNSPALTYEALANSGEFLKTLQIARATTARVNNAHLPNFNSSA
jgi:hypothetical protein